MITRFNKYERLLEDTSWLDNPLVNTVKDTASSIFDIATNPSQEKDIEIDPEFVKMYQETPIGELSAKVYSKLMGLSEIDETKSIIFEGNLSENNSMMEIAHNYYIDNIGEILQSIDTASVKYISRGIEQSTLDEFNKTPITIGTIVSNSIKNWFNSEVPNRNLTEALSVAKIEVKEKYQSVSESIDYYDINEGKFTEAFKGITSFLGKLFNNSRFSKTAGGFNKYTNNMSGTRSSFGGTTTSNKSGTLGSNVLKQPFGSNNSYRGAYKDPNASSLLSKFFSKTGDLISKGAKNIKQWLLTKRQKSPNSGLNESVKKGRLSGMIKSGFGSLWKITKTTAKWGTPIYGIWWLSNSWRSADENTAKEPTREFFTFFEKDMSNRGYMPFSFYDYAGMKFSEIVNERSDNWTEIFKGWCQILERFGVLSSSDSKVCLEQLNTPTFQKYMAEHSNISNELINELQNKWKSNVELPSLGLYSVGILSSFSFLMAKFENELYSGKVPIINTEDSAYGKTIQPGVLQVGDSNEDVAKLQASLQVLGLYDGEINGVYDEKIKAIVTTLQTEAKTTNPRIEINGKVDSETALYLTQRLNLLDLSSVTGSVMGEVKPRELEYKKETQDSIQRMKAVLANR